MNRRQLLGSAACLLLPTPSNAQAVRPGGRRFLSAGSGSEGQAAAYGSSPSSFATTPTVHFHPNSQSATLSSGKVTDCPDLMGLAALSSTDGPLELTDANGIKFWRFNGSEHATIANTLASIANRAIMTVLVGRVHHGRNTVNLVNPRFAAYTNPTTNTAANAGIGLMRATVTTNSAPFLQAGVPAGSTNATDCYKIIPGSQLQVMGVASRSTANGGTRLYINNDTCDVAQQTTSVTGYIGAIIGGLAGASNTENVTQSVNNVFDVYEIAIWNSEVVNANSDAIVAAAVTNWGISALTSQLVLDGDSITDGVATSLATSPDWAENVGSKLTEPGAGLIAASCRVINLGTSGNQTSNLVTKRDATNSVFSAGKYPGGAANNIIAVQIGRNDVAESAGQKSAAMLYSDVVALINTVTTGYLQRGWKVAQVANIAGPNTATVTNGASTIQERLEAFRALIADTTNHLPLNQFLIDCAADSGNTYDGFLTVLHLYDVTVSGDTKFKTLTDAQDTASGYYDSDNTHQRVAGHLLMATGGDTPQYGYGSLA